jgi:hypothetical protein
MNMDMNNNYVSRNGDIMYRIIDGIAVIVNPETGLMYTLDEVGTYIWEQSDGKHTISDIVDMICEIFEVSKSKAINDINMFIGDLTKKNIVMLDEKEFTRTPSSNYK